MLLPCWPMAREPISRPAGFTRCYGCGGDNALGLALEFFRDGDTVIAEWTPLDEHGGFGRLVHGGLLATVIDEAFGWATYALLGEAALTTELSVTYHAGVVCGEPVTVRGAIAGRDAKTVEVRAEIADAKGALAATGIGKMRVLSIRALERLGRFRT